MVLIKLFIYKSSHIFNHWLSITSTDSVGAVALPDGRVLICGGEIFEQTEDEVNWQLINILIEVN